jgi:kumamolisin
MTILAAAGDNDSSDGGSSPANVDMPGSAPHVVCCGGTFLPPGDPPGAPSETVWNDDPDMTDGEGTGGGFSTLFPAQPWQVGIPAAPGGLGRMVPDVSAVADPQTGVNVVLDGQIEVVGGTSLDAPLYAGLFAASGVQLGFVSPTLWAHPECFNQGISGSNGAYSQPPNPGPCSGLGSPKGAQIAALFAKAPAG